MEDLSHSQLTGMARQLEELRDEDALDPQVRAMRGMFDLLAYYAIQGAGLWALAFVLFTLGGPIAEQAGLSFKTMMIGGLIFLLGALIAFRMSLDGKEGQKRDKWLRRQARVYMPLIAVSLAFSCGWYWRHNNPPDRNRADAEKAAWKTCAQIPACVHRATTANWGNDVLQYIGTSRGQ
jgi:hypothetical protein